MLWKNFVWGSIGEPTLPFFFLVSWKRSHFCAHGLVYSNLLAIQQCKSQRDWINFVGTIFGTEKNHFFRTLLHWLCTERVKIIVFSQLYSIIIKKTVNKCAFLCSRFHTFQAFLCLFVPFSNRLEKIRWDHSRDWKLVLFHFHESLPKSSRTNREKKTLLLNSFLAYSA